MLQGPPVIFTTKEAIERHKPPEEPPTMPDQPCNTPPPSLAEPGLGRRCAECLAPVDTSKDERKMFCKDAHRTAFHNRQTVRGRKAMPLVIVERQTRGGWSKHKRASVGIAARKRLRKLIAIWIAEDKAAGRMSMTEYVEQRQRLGLEND
jgi:hypothetical protein